MVLKELILTVTALGGCGGFERTHFSTVSTSGRVWSVLKELILTVYTLGGCGDPERTYFNTFYIWRVWWSSKN